MSGQGAFSVLFSFIFSLLSTPLFTIGFPVFFTIGEIESRSSGSGGDYRPLLTYWVIYGIVTLVEYPLAFMLQGFPLWHILKGVASIVLIFPDFSTSKSIYEEFLGPMFSDAEIFSSVTAIFGQFSGLLQSLGANGWNIGFPTMGRRTRNTGDIIADAMNDMNYGGDGGNATSNLNHGHRRSSRSSGSRSSSHNYGDRSSSHNYGDRSSSHYGDGGSNSGDYENWRNTATRRSLNDYVED